MDVPVLEWLDALSHPDGSGRWASGIEFDASHPNTEGHRRMFATIDVSMFDGKAVAGLLAKMILNGQAKSAFESGGFQVVPSLCKEGRCGITIKNATSEKWIINPGWQELQKELEAAKAQRRGVLKEGIYIAAGTSSTPSDAPTCVAVDAQGRIETRIEVQADCTLNFHHASSFFRPSSGAEVLFYDGTLALIQESDGFVLLNEATCEYNVHPMWQEVRLASRKLPHGLYESGTGAPFSSAIISTHGLCSRVKVPARSGVRLQRTKELDQVEQVALMPIGDRCTTRMLLHKIEYDGPCYPFDLARCMAIADTSDILRHGFAGFWDPSMLVWDASGGRVRHTRWTSLSFAHEVEEGEDPETDMAPVFARMAKRYSGRAARFKYACEHATRVLFVRTGCASRAEVEDLLANLAGAFKVALRLLLISDQPSEEFASLETVTHVRENFDPDRMHEDEQYWRHCANRFRDIMDRQGVTSRNLYWCPNSLKEAERELSEPPPVGLLRSCVVKDFSHCNLYQAASLDVEPTSA